MNVLSNMTTLRGGKYRILRPLGHGSFGVTYLATAKFVVKGTLGELETEVKVAVKEFFMGDINTRAADGRLGRKRLCQLPQEVQTRGRESV